MLRRLLPPSGPVRALAVAQACSSLGDGAYYVCAALYFTRVVGLSPTQLGLGLTIAGMAALGAGVPLGRLADRRGLRGTAALLTLGAGLAVAAFLAVRSYPLFVLAACAYLVCQRGATAVRQALLASLVDPATRTEHRAHLQVAYNGALALGAALGGLALRFDTREAYLAALALDAASFFAAALVFSRVPAVPGATPGPERPGHGLGALGDRPFALVSLVNFFMVLHVPLIDVVIPLWVARYTTAPKWIIAALFVLNTVAVVLFQVRVAAGVRGLDGAVRHVRGSGALLFAACAVFASSALWPWAWLASGLVLLASALQVAGEMAQVSGAWEIGFDLAGPGRQGQYQAVFGTGPAAAEMIGPLLLTTLVVGWGPPGWIALGVLFLAAGLAMGPAVSWARRTRQAGPAGPEPGRR